MYKVAIDDLVGVNLSWALLRAMGLDPQLGPGDCVVYRSDHGSWQEAPSSVSDAADLVVRHWISVERPSTGQNPPVWRAIADTKYTPQPLQNVVAAFSERYQDAVFKVYIKSMFSVESVMVPRPVLR